MKKTPKTSSDRPITVLFQEIQVAESNGNARILIGSSEITVSAYVQYKFGQTLINAHQLANMSSRIVKFVGRCITVIVIKARNGWRDVGDLCNASQLPPFLVSIIRRMCTCTVESRTTYL